MKAHKRFSGDQALKPRYWKGSPSQAYADMAQASYERISQKYKVVDKS